MQGMRSASARWHASRANRLKMSSAGSAGGAAGPALLLATVLPGEGREAPRVAAQAEMRSSRCCFSLLLPPPTVPAPCRQQGSKGAGSGLCTGCNAGRALCKFDSYPSVLLKLDCPHTPPRQAAWQSTRDAPAPVLSPARHGQAGWTAAGAANQLPQPQAGPSSA